MHMAMHERHCEFFGSQPTCGQHTTATRFGAKVGLALLGVRFESTTTPEFGGACTTRSVMGLVVLPVVSSAHAGRGRQISTPRTTPFMYVLLYGILVPGEARERRPESVV
jgi:hypothetical protein